MGFFYLYYALGLPTFLIIIIALYLLFTGTNSSHMPPFIKGTFNPLLLAELVLTLLCVVSAGSGEAFNVGQFLEETSPYLWASTGIGLCIGFSVLGAGWCVHRAVWFVHSYHSALGASSSLARLSSAVVSRRPA